MKTRIISGIVMVCLVALVLVAGYNFNPLVITAFIALLSMGGTYELVHNALGVKGALANIAPAIASAALTVSASFWFGGLSKLAGGSEEIDFNLIYTAPLAIIITVALYWIIASLIILKSTRSSRFLR